MTIRENIQDVINTILQEQAINGGQSATADDVQLKAMAAIFAGGGSNEWTEFMTLFAGSPTNPQQLARLVPTDGTHTNDDMQEARAFLVANGITCGGTTADLLANTVDNRLVI